MVENDIKRLEEQLPLHIPMVRTAYEFAAHWHGSINQVRKNSQLPYIVHPMRVAIAGVNRLGGLAAFENPLPSSIIDICVRLNHDVKEDVEPLQDQQIIDAMGMQVYLGIRWLTGPDDCDPKLKKLSRSIRNHVYHHQLAYAPAGWKLAKLDDRLDNLNDSINDDFYRTTYIDETAELLDALASAICFRCEVGHTPSCLPVEYPGHNPDCGAHHGGDRIRGDAAFKELYSRVTVRHAGPSSNRTS
jgi:(p)ppGpp synthase/HD superfamily hydrolase